MASKIRNGLFVALVFLIVGGQAAAQEPAFEVASVRRNTSGMSAGRFDRPPGRFRTTNIPLIVILQTAFGLSNHEIVDAPAWILRERFDIDAVEPAGTFNQDQRNAMIRTLLRDRFKLNAHKESRDSAVYSLVLARADRRLGPAIQESTAESRTSNNFDPVNGFMLDAKGMTIAQFVRIMDGYLTRPIFDATNLDGKYDFLLRFAPEPGSPAAKSIGQTAFSEAKAPAIFTALQEQLGLKLEAARRPMEVLVIDEIERPSDN